LDPQLIIAKLKRQIVQLKAELALARGESSADERLPDYELQRLKALVEAYLEGDDEALIFTDYRKVNAAFAELRNRLIMRPPATDPPPNSQTTTQSSVKYERPPTTVNDRELNRLKSLVYQRDIEISVLIPMLNQCKARLRDLGENESDYQSEIGNEAFKSSCLPSISATNTNKSMISSRPTALQPISSKEKPKQIPQPICMDEDRQGMLEAFKRSYPPMSMIEQQKADLKERYSTAKELGQAANDLRSKISKLPCCCCFASK
jgi:kinesin family protein 6/9